MVTRTNQTSGLNFVLMQKQGPEIDGQKWTLC
jgi:hypothetical protein